MERHGCRSMRVPDGGKPLCADDKLMKPKYSQ